MAIRLWIRQDKTAKGSLEEPKAVAIDATTAPGPGELVDVDAPTPAEARRVLKLARMKQVPDRKDDRETWNAWDDAKDRVRLVERTDVPAPPAGG